MYEVLYRLSKLRQASFPAPTSRVLPRTYLPIIGAMSEKKSAFCKAMLQYWSVPIVWLFKRSHCFENRLDACSSGEFGAVALCDKLAFPLNSPCLTFASVLLCNCFLPLS